MKTYYKFKFYLNGKHSVTFEGKNSNIHPHTWEITVLLEADYSNTVNFTDFEKTFEKYFLNYEGKYLNELEEFIGINPTMENIGKIIYNNIKMFVNDKGLDFISLEISENPTRTYIIED